MRKAIKRVAQFLWFGTLLLIHKAIGRGHRYNSYVIRIAGSYPEIVPFSPLRFFRRDKADFPDLVRGLQRAARDERITTAAFLIAENRMGLARTQEVARLIAAIRAAGKKTVAVVEGGSTKEYILAAQCERVVVAPPAILFLTGLLFESVFLKDLLDHLDVQPDLMHVGKFKNAAETLTRTGPSKPADEMMKTLVSDLHREAVGMIAKGRGVSPETVQGWIDGGPYSADEAKEAGIADDVAYWDEVRKGLGFDEGKRRFVRAAAHDRFHSRVEHYRSVLRDDPVIALVPAAGPIADRPSGRGGIQITTRALVRVLSELRKDDDVKAVVLRVSSPGGSAVASDLIHRELTRLAKKKPLVVSMGDVAASGGYYLAMAGKTVLVEGASLTGSIGVISGKVSFKGLYDKIGVRKTRYQSGANAAVLSDYGRFSPAERARMKALNESFYRQFTGKVAASRSLPAEDVEKAAQGRVVAGSAAVPLRLADRLGGLSEALAEAARQIGATGEGRVEVVEYLREPWMGLGGLSALGSGAAEVLGPLASLWDELQTVSTKPTCLAASRPRLEDADEW